MLGDVLWAPGAAFHEAVGEGHGRCPTAEICLTKCKVERARKWSGRCSGGRSMLARAIQEGIDTLFDFSETTRLGSLLVQACAPIRGEREDGSDFWVLHLCACSPVQLQCRNLFCSR